MSTPHDRAFLSDILAHPEDDTPRLIYADWLTDHGNPDRAEFIRVQIERARLDEDDPAQDDLERREQRLLGRHPEWYADLAEWEHRPIGTFRRGFLHEIDADPNDFLRRLDDLSERAPVRSLRMREDDGLRWDEVGRLFSSPGFARLREFRGHHFYDGGVLGGWHEVWTAAETSELRDLDLTRADLGIDGLRALLDSPVAAGLTGLGLRGSVIPDGLGGGEAVSPLCQDDELRARLSRLDLGEDGARPQALEEFAAVEWPCLRELDLGHNFPGNEGVTALSRASLPSLTSLRLYNLVLPGYALGREFLIRLLKSSVGAGLARLRLGQVTNEAPGAEIVARSSLSGLRHLDLSDDISEDDHIRQLAAWPGLASVTRLNLSSNRISAAGVAALVRSQYLGSLRVLDLGSNPLGDEGVCALADGLDLPSLRWLSLGGVNMTDEGAGRLANCPGLAGVTYLDLSCNPFGTAGALALAGSPYLGNLGRLWLHQNEIDGRGIRGLAAAPWLAGVWELILESNPIDSEGVTALLNSPLTYPTRLNLGDYHLSLSHYLRNALQERFGRALWLLCREE
jgi:uncharacterized protein (TIGR02996 family)